MKRRDFIKTGGCGILGVLMANLGFTQDMTEKEAKEREEYIIGLLMRRMNKTRNEAEKMIKDFKEKLPKIKEMCICKKCPTYQKGEKEVGFCNPLVGKSKIIEVENGCLCPSCPVYKEMGLTFGYYCIRKSELEQKLDKEKKGKNI